MLCFAGDVGKTSVRVALMEGVRVLDMARHPSPAVLRSDSDATRIARSLSRAAAELMSARAHEQHPAIWCLSVAGAGTTPALARTLAHSLMDASVTERVVIGSDIVAAHLSGLGGQFGTVLIAGTGATALAVPRDREPAQRDGHGPILGDLGSAAWIGTRAVRAAIAAREGRAPETALTPRILGRATPSDLVREANKHDNPYAWVASHAGTVLELWQEGDEVAGAIVVEAIQELVRTAAAADPAPERVAITGGLVNSASFAGALTEALRFTLGVEQVGVNVDILDGVVRLADLQSLPVGAGLAGLVASFARSIAPL